MKPALRLLVGMSLILQVTSLMAATPDSDADIDVGEIALLGAAVSSVSLTDAMPTRTPTPACFEAIFELKGRRSAQLNCSPAAGSPVKLAMRMKPATCIEDALVQLCERLSLDPMFLVILTEDDDTGQSALQLSLDAHYCQRSAVAMLSKVYGDFDYVPKVILDTTVRTHLQTVVDAILACLKEYAVSGGMLTISTIPGMQPIVLPADTRVECHVFEAVPAW